VHHLDELEAYIAKLEEENGKGNGGEISVGQWEVHPWLGRDDIADWCKQRGTIVQAYSPVVRGQRFDEPILQPLVKKHGKTAAQILLRWSLQKVIRTRPRQVMSLTWHSRVLFHYPNLSRQSASKRTQTFTISN
jgi:diketogulonate reductase-like aldo/keto reductase